MNYIIQPTDSDIQHHGVLGQKWGKRNGPPYPLDKSVSTGKKIKEKKKNDRPVKAKAYNRKKSSVRKEALSKDINKISNEELKKYNERMRLESEFSRLAKGKDSISTKFGDSISNKLVEEYSRQLVASVAAVATVAAGKALVKKIALAII